MTFKRKPSTRVPVTPLKSMTLQPFTTGRTDAPEQPKRGPRIVEAPYIIWLHGERCCAQSAACLPPIQASHHWPPGETTRGRRASDKDSITLCKGHHMGEFHGKGSINGMTGEVLQEWLAARKRYQLDRFARGLEATEGDSE